MKKLKRFSGREKLVAAGLALISLAVITSLLVPGVGLVDEWLIPIGVYLIKTGVEKRGRKKRK